MIDYTPKKTKSIQKFGRGRIPVGVVPKTLVVMECVPRNDAHKSLPSKVTEGHSGALKETQKYTGTEMIGISIIHKSSLQPIFSTDSAKDVANMRR